MRPAVVLDEVGNMNAIRLEQVFSGADIAVEMSERPGLMEAAIRGRGNE
jgi:hypothetical protein